MAQTKIRSAQVLGRNLRTLRTKRKATQQTFADLLGVDRANLSKAETGRANPLLSTIADWAHRLGVTPARLMRDRTGRPVPRPS